MENYNMEEKRRFKRVNADLTLEYRDLRKSSEIPKGSLLKNIGEGGICFQAEEFMSLACRLVVNIVLPNSPKPVKAISKVAWIRKLPLGSKYELGNQFLEITKEDRAHIKDYINRAASPSI